MDAETNAVAGRFYWSKQSKTLDKVKVKNRLDPKIKTLTQKQYKLG